MSGLPFTNAGIQALSDTEVGFIDGVTAGTVTASKAIVVGADKEVDTLAIAASGLKIGAGAGTAVTATAAELNYNAAVVAGTAAVSKAVVLGSGKTIDEMNVTLLKVGTVDKSNVLIGAAAGYKLARSASPVALDGSNPTTVASGLTTIVAAGVSFSGTAAPGLSTSTLAVAINSTNLDVYAWKPTGAGDTTLVASTGTESFHWWAIGT